jgi:multiple sugar transport system substrate-binding protein
MQPKGPKAQHSGSFADGMGVSAFTKKKEAAYLYVQWATSKAMAARQLQGGYGAPAARGSTPTRRCWPARPRPRR